MKRWRLWIAALLMIWGASAGVARAAIADLIPSVKPSVVAVGSFQRTRSPAFVFFGTGFAVGDGTLIATNAHVRMRTLNTEQFETLAVQVPDGAGRFVMREATRIAVDEQHDLALLKIAGPPLPALRLASGAGVEGEPIFLLGFPLGGVLGLFPAAQAGIISAIAPVSIPASRAGGLDAAAIRQIAAGNFSIYVLDAYARPGNSGSPVFNTESGEVLAVVSAGQVRQAHEGALGVESTGITYAVPVEFLQRLLRESK